MADQAINALSTKTAPETSDQLLLVGTGEPQLIDYDKLADAILNTAREGILEPAEEIEETEETENDVWGGGE